jgi:trans-aconitate 2-methyltransferase
MKWDPSTYLKFSDERSRPFHDLVARVGATTPRTVVDLGCGPGDQTVTLADRWPSARIFGLDSSADMIERAREQPGSVDFSVGDVVDWKPSPDVDVVISNATLQWVPSHRSLLSSWVPALADGAWLAFQVPGNFDAPSHTLLRQLAESPAWSSRATGLRGTGAVDPAQAYAERLLALGCAVDAWETTYMHVLTASPDGPHPVLHWMSGTALRPLRAALSAADYAAFTSELEPLLAEAYPVVDGRTLLPFRRIFVVAHRR